jgi:hypothetical protein
MKRIILEKIKLSTSSANKNGSSCKIEELAFTNQNFRFKSPNLSPIVIAELQQQ